MAYTICDQRGDPRPIRLIVPNIKGEPQLKEAFTPCWWVCDPCNRSERRYEVTYRSDQIEPQYFSWYQLVTTDDTEEDIEAMRVSLFGGDTQKLSRVMAYACRSATIKDPDSYNMEFPIRK